MAATTYERATLTKALRQAVDRQHFCLSAATALAAYSFLLAALVFHCHVGDAYEVETRCVAKWCLFCSGILY